MFQTWDSLTFLHWRYQPDVIRRVVPPQLELDTFDGAAWVGLTPFLLTGLRPPLLPRIPWVSTFPEMNVRTCPRTRRRTRHLVPFIGGCQSPCGSGRPAFVSTALPLGEDEFPKAGRDSQIFERAPLRSGARPHCRASGLPDRAWRTGDIPHSPVSALHGSRASSGLCSGRASALAAAIRAGDTRRGERNRKL